MIHPIDLDFIIPADATEPKPGFYAVKLGRRTVERALLIERSNDGVWSVSMDGYRIGQPNTVWENAAGHLSLWFLLGRKLDEREYNALVALRKKDADNGIDHYRPLDLNAVNPPFMGE